uniref:Uncharacterized protein n=1 Tax=Arundo donax TaxID=35708 RepID=A0A0A9GV01_ARUDO
MRCQVLWYGPGSCIFCCPLIQIVELVLFVLRQPCDSDWQGCSIYPCYSLYLLNPLIPFFIDSVSMS